MICHLPQKEPLPANSEKENHLLIIMLVLKDAPKNFLIQKLKN